MKRYELLNMHAWIGALILWSYMFSLYVFKIWYITTALVAYLTIVLVFNRILNTKGLVIETLILLTYFLYLFISTLWSIYPIETLKGVAIDSIYIVVFAIAYLSVLNITTHKIVELFLYLPFVGLISTIALYDPGNIRIGEYAYLILPVAIPFIFLSMNIFRKSYLFISIPSLLITFGISAVSMSRASIVATALCTLLSAAVYSRNKRHFASLSVLVLASAAMLVVVLMQIPVTNNAINYSLGRIEKTYEHYDGSYKATDSARDDDDRIRNEITRHVIELIPDYALSGIGYRNFKKYSEERYGRPTNLHSIYHIWIVEGGIILVIIAISIIARFYYRLLRFINVVKDYTYSAIAKSYLISMSVTLFIGLFHQSIQSPIFFIILGGGIALTHKLIYVQKHQFSFLKNSASSTT